MDDEMIKNIRRNDRDVFICPRCGRILALEECEVGYAMEDVKDMKNVLEKAYSFPVCPDCHVGVIAKAEYVEMMMEEA